MRNAKFLCRIPHSALRTPHCQIAGAFLMLVAMMFAPAIGGACPGCKESLFDPGQLPQRLAIAKGYALSIGLMLAVPLGLVGGLTVLIVRSARSRRG